MSRFSAITFVVMSMAMVCKAAALQTLRAESAFTVDAMMKTEELGEVMFDPKGKKLLIERIAPYDADRNFALVKAWNRNRSMLLEVTLADGSTRYTSKGEGDWMSLGSYSPNGSRAAIGWFDGDLAKTGVLDFDDGVIRKLDILTAPDICAFDCPLWISEDEFVHYTLSVEDQEKGNSLAYHNELIYRNRHSSWKGGASVEVFGSRGKQIIPEDVGGKLIKVDALSGHSTILGKGLFYAIEASPDRRLLLTLHPIRKLQTYIPLLGTTDEVLGLTIYDLKGEEKLIPCLECDVIAGSTRWSPSGRKLFFAVRNMENDQEQDSFFIFDIPSKKLKPFAPPGLDLRMVQKLGIGLQIIPFVWLSDDVPAIRATRSSSNADEAIYDWYAIPPGAPPVNMTLGLRSEHESNSPDDFVVAHDGALYVMLDSQLWRLSEDGQRENLTSSIDEPILPWCSVVGFYRNAGFRQQCSGLRMVYRARPPDPAALAEGWLTFAVLESAATKIPTGDVLFFNVYSGNSVRIHAPQPEAQLLTASPLARAAIYKVLSPDGDQLLLARPEVVPKKVMQINEHLNGIVGGTPVMLRRRSVNEEHDRIDWLLLPPHRKPGQRHPLLVYFYPDTEYSEGYRPDSLRDTRALNMQIAAGHGYAVLFASMKISAYGGVGNPMLEMHEQLIAAAENAVNSGYADPQRWALIGHSYGGYGVMGVITQSNRFRAAISLNGVSNITSAYGQGQSGLRMNGVTWAEAGQGRMRVPPWKDPQRYLRNSPVFSAHKIETPLLLLHGDDDVIVDVQQSEQMYVALRRQGKDVEFRRYWGEGHFYSSPGNIRDIWSSIFDWLDDYFGQSLGQVE